MMTAQHTAAHEWRLYWALALTTAVGFSFHSVATYSIGLFIEPLQAEFGWGRAVITAGLTISALLTVPLAPIVGAMIDRWGTRRLAIPGLILKALSLCVFAFADGSEAQWYALWTFYALVALGVKATVWTAAISSVFSAGRGLALAVTLSGTAVAQILAPPLTQWLIAEFGWRTAWVALGLGWGFPALLLAILCLYDARDRERRARAPGDTSAPSLDLRGLTPREALRSTALIRIGIATLVILILTIGVIVHQVPILAERGVDREKAAYLASLAGVAGIVGKLLTGYLMDRVDAGWVAAATMSALAVALFALLRASADSALLLFAIALIGYASGCKIQICAYLTSRYAGMRHFGKIFGVMSSLIALGAGLGPLLVGAVHDAYGGYAPFLLAGIPGALLGGFLLVGLGPYPDWSAAQGVKDSSP
ncbi:MFS transporter [Mangrovimicrobium sediminis]|nr:MFS transporter [Haliea sp. SAOS-164]